MSTSKIAHDSETPALGQQVITACAFIHRLEQGKHQVFLPKRADTKKFLPGVYEFPGGHIDFGEDMIAGLKREILEEFSLEISVGDPFYCFTYDNPVKGSHSIEVVYFAQFEDSQAEIVLNPEDHSQYRWFGLEEVEEINKGNSDPEVKALIKGFALLNGEKLDYN
jgi:8-oxo-dGTP diphosphatase